MSLSGWEQQALDSIKDGLASSDPRLAARLNIFTRLASGEEMPAREKLPAGARRSRPRPRRPRRGAAPGHAHQVRQRTGLPRVMPLLWLVITAALIVVALVCSRVGSHGGCTTPWASSCTGATAASDPALGSPSAGTLSGSRANRGTWSPPPPGRARLRRRAGVVSLARLAADQPIRSRPRVSLRVFPGPGMVRLSSEVLRPQWRKAGMA